MKQTAEKYYHDAVLKNILEQIKKPGIITLKQVDHLIQDIPSFGKLRAKISYQQKAKAFTSIIFKMIVEKKAERTEKPGQYYIISPYQKL